MRASHRRARQPNRVDARDVLRAVLGRDAVGRIRIIGEGLSNVVYGAWIERVPGETEAVVVALPSRDAGGDRDEPIRGEADLLRHLCRQSLPFSVPRPLDDGRLALVDWGKKPPSA
ncbi:MAG: hypothetical protein ACT4PJ_14230 [Gemmatimonadaceae bacterium]